MIEYKSLDFLGFPYYKVDNLGNIYKFIFHRSHLDIDSPNKIKSMYITKQYLQKELAEIFITSIDTIKKVLKTKEENYWTKMKIVSLKDGRQKVTLCNGPKRKDFLLHRLILLAFVGPCPDGKEGCHNNGNPSENYLENLRWDTPSNNQADRIKHGTSNRGERQGRSKLTKIDILNIKELNKFLTQIEIALIYKVDRSNISAIIRNKSWKHI